jgi:hypothetical protein
LVLIDEPDSILPRAVSEKHAFRSGFAADSCHAWKTVVEVPDRGSRMDEPDKTIVIPTKGSES